MTSLVAKNVSLRFPVIGADNRSLKKYLSRVAIGGQLSTTMSQRTLVVQALTNVNLALSSGDRVALVGPNGAGKTTLLRALAGVYEPDDGYIEATGRVAALLDIGLGIDPSATGYENIRLRAMVAGLESAEIKRRTDEIAEFSGLGGFLGLPMKTYSAGMMARLAFAVSTAIDADILLMDEWIAVGDADFIDHAQQRLMELVERSAILVLATHNFALARTLCRSFIHLEHGVASPLLPMSQLDDYLAARNEPRVGGTVG